VDNTQAYVASNDEHLVVAFRGSEGPTSLDGLKDWFLTNALNFLIEPTGPLSTEFKAAGVGARWHQGFVGAIGEIWEPLYTEVDARLKQKDRLFWVTGHSLGGALALLGSWMFFRRSMMPHQVYTFGAPMVGNKPVADAFDTEFGDKIARYVNGPDPVPLLPMLSLVANEFAHCGGSGVLLGPAEQAANLISYVQESAGGLIQGALSGDVQEKVWGAIKGKVAAHLLDDYRKLIG
jgi:predicted lipase